jgi:predicted metalloprotease
MRWKRVKSTDVIDQRAGGGSGFPGGGRVAIPSGLGVAGIIIYLAIQVLAGGSGGASFPVNDPFGGATQAPGAGAPRGIPAAQDPDRDLKDFSVYVFERTQQTWEKTFGDQGQPYEHAKLVLYRGGVNTACGGASSSVGPFYCPGDQRVYLDLSFYGDMQDQLQAGGDFAWAYVIAHEMGHHVQEQLGTSDKVSRLQRDNPDDRNALSVRLELQADCYAGVWAKTVYEDLEPGDIEEAMTASRAVGDDRLQRQATGSVNPDSFTHGTSEQRAKWFDRGRQSGQPADCDTFSGEI